MRRDCERQWWVVKHFNGVTRITARMVEELEKKKEEWIKEGIDCILMHDQLRRNHDHDEDRRGEFNSHRAYMAEKVRSENAAASAHVTMLRERHGDLNLSMLPT